MLTRTLLQLRTAVLEEARMETSDFTDATELNRLINKSIERLRDKVLAMPGGFALVGKVATLSGTGPVLTLPTDCMQVYQLLTQASQGQQVDHIAEEDRPYAVEATGTLSFRLEYIPSFTRLVNDGDTYTFLPAWADYVECDVAASLLEMEESDPSAKLRRRDDALEVLMLHASRSRHSSPTKVRDVRFRRWPYAQTAYKYRLEGLNQLRIYQVERYGA